MSYAIRSKQEGPFRRDGLTFLPDKWLEVAEPTERQLNEAALEVVKFKSRNDPDLVRFPFLSEGDEETPAPSPVDNELSQDSVLAWAEKHEMILVTRKKADELDGETTRLEGEVTSHKEALGKLKADNEVLETSVQEAEKATKDATAGHKTEIADLKTAHKAEIDKLKAELATAKKGS